MRNFHVEFRRVFNRVPFVALADRELAVGYGRHTVLVTAGKWFFHIGLT